MTEAVGHWKLSLIGASCATQTNVLAPWISRNLPVSNRRQLYPTTFWLGQLQTLVAPRIVWRHMLLDCQHLGSRATRRGTDATLLSVVQNVEGCVYVWT